MASRTNGLTKVHEHDADALLERLTPIPFEMDDHVHRHDEGELPFAHLEVLDLERFDLSQLVGILGTRRRRQASPWAVLVVRFRDDPAPASMAPYERVFTSTGTGSMNMVDYFADMSHGLLDLSGTRVFGPYVIDRPRSDYVGNVYPQPDGKLNRNGVLDVARGLATSQGVDLSGFAGVVVCGTPQLDLCGWVGGHAALCDDLSLQPSLLGQEMGHGYGLDHSRRDGSDDDYQDAWDTMSTANAYMAAHPEYGAVGPGLNAWNMRLRGWLNEQRVHVVSVDGSSTQTFTLRPLHARRLSGTLALQVSGYLVEFRVRTGWDAGIPRPCVLVHRESGNQSYVMRGTGGQYDLGVGDTFEVGRPDGLFAEHVRVHVDAIDATGQTATITVTYVPLHRPHIPELVGSIFGGIAVDGGGFVVIGGKVVPVPPRGPMFELLEHVVGLIEADAVATRSGRPATRTEAITPVLHALVGLVGHGDAATDSPPGVERLRRLRAEMPG